MTTDIIHPIVKAGRPVINAMNVTGSSVDNYFSSLDKGEVESNGTVKPVLLKHNLDHQAVATLNIVQLVPRFKL